MVGSAEGAQEAGRAVTGLMAPGVRTNVSLRRAILLGGVGLTVLLVVATITTLIFQYRDAVRGAEHHAVNLVRVLGAQTDAAVASVDQSLLRVVDTVKDRPLVSLAEDEALHRLLGAIRDHIPYVRSVYIVDDQGRAVTYPQVNLKIQPEEVGRDYFLYHRDHRGAGLFIGSPMTGWPAGEWQIALTRRLEHADHSFAGVVVGILDTDYLQTLYDSIDVGSFGIVSLLQIDGRLLVRSPLDARLMGRSMADARQFKTMVAAGQRRGSDRGPYLSDGRVRIGAYEFIESGRLILRVALDEYEALASWRQAVAMDGVSVFSIISILAILSHLLGIQLRRRERAEAELQESHRLATSTIDALTTRLCVLDETGTVIVVNQAWRETGERQALPSGVVGRAGLVGTGVGSNYLTICDGAESDGADVVRAFAAGIRAVMAGTLPEYVQEYPCATPNGWRWFVARVTRFVSSGPVRVAVVHRDITARRYAAQAVVREKERAETYLTISESIIVELDTVGRIRRINPRGCAVLGLDENLLIGSDWFVWLSPTSARSMARAGFLRVMRGEAEPVAYTESTVMTRRGERRIIAWHSVVLAATDGRVAGLLSSGQEVTERRKMEDTLRESERRLAKAQSIAHLGNWEVDCQSGTVWWSDEVYRIFGRKFGDFAAGFVDYLRYVAVEDRPNLYEQERRMMAEGTAINADLRIVRPDGSVRIVNFQAERIVDGDGVVRRTVGIVHDITERKRAELELLHAVQQVAVANRTKTEFLANMSHELNTPLNAVIGFSEMIAEESCGPLGHPKYREFGRVIYDSGRHLQHIIADLLELTKIDAGDAELEDDVVDVREEACQRLRFLAPAITAAGLTLAPVVVDAGLGLLADRRMLKQILQNLLSNAVKFTPPGGTLALSVRRAADGRLCFAVVDTGIGMATEDIPRALDRFSQIDGTIARQHDGTGLGLSLAKLLVERHGGCIKIVSAVGCGTTVEAWFPAERVVDIRETMEAESPVS